MLTMGRTIHDQFLHHVNWVNIFMPAVVALDCHDTSIVLQCSEAETTEANNVAHVQRRVGLTFAVNEQENSFAVIALSNSVKSYNASTV